MWAGWRRCRSSCPCVPPSAPTSTWRRVGDAWPDEEAAECVAGARAYLEAGDRLSGAAATAARRRRRAVGQRQVAAGPGTGVVRGTGTRRPGGAQRYRAQALGRGLGADPPGFRGIHAGDDPAHLRGGLPAGGKSARGRTCGHRRRGVRPSRATPRHCPGGGRWAGVPFEGLWLEAPAPVMESRISGRRRDVSDATSEILRNQLAYKVGKLTWQRLETSGERENTVDRAKTLLECKRSAVGVRFSF